MVEIPLRSDLPRSLADGRYSSFAWPEAVPSQVPNLLIERLQAEHNPDWLVVPVQVPFRDSELPGSRSGRCRLPPSIQTEDAIRLGLERFLCLGPSVAWCSGSSLRRYFQSSVWCHRNLSGRDALCSRSSSTSSSSSPRELLEPISWTSDRKSAPRQFVRYSQRRNASQEARRTTSPNECPYWAAGVDMDTLLPILCILLQERGMSRMS